MPANRTETRKPSSEGIVRVAVIGAGRIGEVHLSNLTRRVKGVEVTGLFDLDRERANALGARFGVPVAEDLERMLDDGADCVVGSSSASHLDHVKLAARAGLHVLCEKPLALDEAGITEAIGTCRENGRLLQVGFNRRFDPNTTAMREAVASGRIGALRSLRITSRDPSPPSIEYVRSSGGMILDMTVHDLDLARFLSGVEVAEVFAYGGSLIDPAIGEAGDVDVATILLRFVSGAVGVIENTRATPYGYDQRVEILGADASVESENMTPHRVLLRGTQGQTVANPLPFFLERYETAFVGEMQAFVDAVRSGGEVAISGEDALRAYRIAKAIERSFSEGKPVRLER